MCGVIVMNNNLEIVFKFTTYYIILRTKNQHVDIKKEEVYYGRENCTDSRKAGTWRIRS